MRGLELAHEPQAIAERGEMRKAMTFGDCLRRKRWLRPASRQETVATILCFCGALFLALYHIDITTGVFPSWFKAGHRGWFVCPFCGGTRAFCYVVRLQFWNAMHSSIIGTWVSVWILVTFPIRAWFCAASQSRKAMRVYWRLKKLEAGEKFLIMTAICVVTQMVLHYQCGFYWLPLVQFFQDY